MPTPKNIVESLKAEKEGLEKRKAAATDEDTKKVLSGRIADIGKTISHYEKQDKSNKRFATLPTPKKRTKGKS